MIQKRIYIVRHGATAGNIENFFQSAHEPLSPVGVDQARAVAGRFGNISVSKIIASPMARARETAEHIAGIKEMEVETSELFEEIKRPSELVGKSRASEDAKIIFKDIRVHELDKDWRHSDEETLYDLEQRARKALDLLKSIPDQNVLVVTHGFLSRMLLSVMMTEDSDEAVRFYSSFRYFALQANTSVSVVEYGEIDGFEKWGLRAWNDVRHLPVDPASSMPE